MAAMEKRRKTNELYFQANNSTTLTSHSKEIETLAEFSGEDEKYRFWIGQLWWFILHCGLTVSLVVSIEKCVVRCSYFYQGDSFTLVLPLIIIRYYFMIKPTTQCKAYGNN